MKKNIGKRILSLALTLVLVVGLLPMTAYADVWVNASAVNALCDTYENCIYLTELTKDGVDKLPYVDNVYITGCTRNGNKVTFEFRCQKKRNSEGITVTGSFTITDADCSQAVNTTATYDHGYGVNATFRINRSAKSHTGGTATCIAKAKCSACGKEYGDYGDHSWGDWTTSNGKHIRTCTLDTTHTESGNCDHKPETCLAASACSVCKHEYAAKLDHSYTYTADGFVLTETCTNGCGHQAIADIVAGEAIYTGSAITNTATISYTAGTWAGDKPVLSFENNVTVGTATAKMTAGDATASTTFKINPANLSYATVTLNPESGTYTGSYHDKPTYTLTYNGEELDKGTDYIVDGQWTGDFLNAGSYDLLLKGNGNFTGYKSLTYTIGKGTPTKEMFAVQWPQEPVYDGDRKEVTVTSNKEGMGQITVIYFQGNDLEHTLDPIDAHGYNVAINVAEGENYNGATIILGSFSISSATGQIEIPAGQTVIYDGEAIIAGTSGADILYYYNGDSTPQVKWYADMGGTMGGEISAPTDAGTYWIGVSAGEGNYTEVEEVKQTFTITKADPICTAPTAIAGLVYNGKEKTLIYSAGCLDGTVYYSLDGENYTESLPMAVNAQEYTVYYKVVGDRNHNDMEPKTVTATIAPFNIGTTSIKGGVLGDSFTYNGQEHTPDVQIDVSIPSGEANVPDADVRLTEGTDYTVAYSDNVNAGQAVVTFTGEGNYTGTITREFTIAPKPITVTIADKTSVYGETVAELTAATDGIVNNDPNVYSLATNASSTANAGTYPITGTALDANYDITFVNGTYTVTKAPVNSTGTDMAVSYSAGMEVDLRQMFSIDENAGAVDYWITYLTGEGSFTGAPYLYRIDKAGTFTVKITTEETANYNSGEATAVLTVNPGDPGIGIVTANVVENTLNSGAIVLTRENTDIDGNLTVDAEQTLAWGSNTIRYTFTPEDTTNYKVVKDEVAVTVVDTIAPVGTVTVSTKSWAEFLNNITFGLFFKETQTVSVSASDNLSGVAKIEYIESKTALDLDAVKAATQWTEMKNGSVSVTREDTKQFVYYIRITDKAGNVAYLSSDGAEYDTTAPVIAGVDNGVTYYTTQKVTVTDKNIDTITLNGKAATGSITLEGNKEAVYTIVATDKAGNETTVTVTMKPIKALAEATENRGNDNVTSADAPALEALVEKLDELIADPDTSDDGEKETLQQHKVVAESLLQTIEENAAEQKTVTDEAAKYDKDAVKSTDKAGLAELAEDIDDLLDTDNLTQDERAALEALSKDVKAMIDTVNDAAADSKTAADTVDSYDPATVTSSGKAAIESALETIEDLLDTKHLTDTERAALEDAKADAEALLEIIDEAAKAADTDNTAKVENVTAGNVKPDHKSDLEKAKADLEGALTDNGGNYTEEEKKAIQDEIQRIKDALETIGNVEAAEDAISDLPATVEPDDEETVAKIEEAKKSYDKLNDYEKSLIDEKVKEKLDKLTAATVDYKIVKGDNGKWSKDTASGLTFTANGAFSKFVSVEIDGKVIDAKHYSAKSGSTIVTLNASYLETLPVGTHTITVVYTNGEAEGTFTVNAKSVTPATGDNSDILLWTSVMIMCLAAIAVLLIEQKKRKYVK